jgi:hypothetical protein
MAIEGLTLTDKWFKFGKNTQLDNIRLLHNYTIAHDLTLDLRDKFPRQIVPNSPEHFRENKIYKYDIKCNLLNITPEQALTGYMGAQFISDEEKIILRAFYPAEDFSIAQRDRMSENLIEYLCKRKKSFTSNITPEQFNSFTISF